MRAKGLGSDANPPRTAPTIKDGQVTGPPVEGRTG